MIKTIVSIGVSSADPLQLRALPLRVLRLRLWAGAAALGLSSGFCIAPVMAAQTKDVERKETPIKLNEDQIRERQALERQILERQDLEKQILQRRTPDTEPPNKEPSEKEGDIVIGETGPQKGEIAPSKTQAGDLTRATTFSRMEKAEALLELRTLDPTRGGMRLPEQIEPLKPLRRAAPGRQAASIVPKQRAEEQIGDLKGPRGQYIALGLDFSKDGIRAGDAIAVPGRTPQSRYLQGGIVWRASIDGRAIEVGSFRDPRVQHSLIPPEDLKEDYRAPEPATTGSWRIPLDEKYLGRDDVARLRVEFFEIDQSIPTDSELNLKTVDRIVEGARRLDAVSGKELYTALYADIDQEREQERKLQQQQDLQ